VVRGVLVVFVLAAATAGLAIGASSVAARVDPRFHPVVLVASLVGLLVLVVPGQARLREAIDHAVFRRSRRRREGLAAFVRGLAPELGTIDCCRRALGELGSVMRLRGAAIVLDDGRAVAEGVVGVAAIERVWRRAAVPIPDAPVWGFAMRELPDDVREALVAAEVVSIVPSGARGGTGGTSSS